MVWTVLDCLSELDAVTSSPFQGSGTFLELPSCVVLS